jgi:membrane protease YdiL (CAAX protease family)
VLLFLLTKERHNGEKELFKRQKWQPCDVVIIMIIWNIILILSTFMALNFKSIYKLNFAFLVSLFLLLIILGYAKVKYKQKNTDFGFRKSLHANLFFISFVLGSFLFVIFSMLLLYSADSNEFLIIKKYFYYIQSGFFLLFITPVLEELLFRGINYSVYRKRYSPKWAIIMSSMLFAPGHIKGIVLPFIAGIVCGMIYERKESLPMAICAHGLVNAGGFIYMIMFNQITVPF